MSAQLDIGRETGATLSDCRTYRYALWRCWELDRGRVVWVMLNPSTADEHADDPTIRRCERYARDWGFGGITVVNLFALRATNPRTLYDHPDPVGPGNDAAIRAHAQTASLVVAAWGNHGDLRHRGAEVLALLRPHAIHVLGTNTLGAPVHPLYQRRDAEPLLYRGDPRCPENAAAPAPSPEEPR